jgi:hypothetical protein
VDPPELTLEQVTITGRTARLVMPPEAGSTYGEGVFREWLFEDGAVWLSYRDDDHTYSVRLARVNEAPHSGWRHVAGCDCHYCAAWRETTSGRTRG